MEHDVKVFPWDPWSLCDQKLHDSIEVPKKRPGVIGEFPPPPKNNIISIYHISILCFRLSFLFFGLKKCVFFRKVHLKKQHQKSKSDKRSATKVLFKNILDLLIHRMVTNHWHAYNGKDRMVPSGRGMIGETISACPRFGMNIKKIFELPPPSYGINVGQIIPISH